MPRPIGDLDLERAVAQISRLLVHEVGQVHAGRRMRWNLHVLIDLQIDVSPRELRHGVGNGSARGRANDCGSRTKL